MNTIDLYTPLANQVARTRGLGIVRGELIIVGTEQKPSFHVVLRADETLWNRIYTAPRNMYPDDLVDALATMVRPIMHLVSSRRVFLTPNEAMMIGLATDEELMLAGIRNEDGVYTVPNAMLHDTEMEQRIANPQYPNQYWAATLNKLEGYNPDNPAHPAGLSIMVLPDRPVTMGELVQTIQVTDPGWNWAATMTAEDFSQVAAQLQRNLSMAQPLGH